ncbi:hypothetical protein U1Q18_047941, partial [Sarracenia purpurea var. burkii]
HAILSYGGNNKVGSGEGQESNIGETIGETVVDCPEGDKAIHFPGFPLIAASPEHFWRERDCIRTCLANP